MGIENANVIDFMGPEDSTGKVVLTIADGMDWEDDLQHIWLLQEKVNAYTSFVESGQLTEERPEWASRKIVFEIVARYEPAPILAKFLAQARAVLAEIGVEIRHRVFQGDD